MTPIEQAHFVKGRLPKKGLFNGLDWRSSAVPVLLEEKWIQYLERLGQILHQFNQACNRLYQNSIQGKQPSWIAQWLDAGKPRELVEFSRHKALKHEVPRVIRPDLLLGEDRMIMCELDSLPGGIGATTWLQETYHELGFPVIGGAKGMRKGWQTIFPEGDVVISHEAQTYRPEMEWLNQNENRVRICSAEDYLANARPIYRFFEAFDLPQLSNIQQWQQAVLNGTPMTPVLKPFLEEKMWLALFWMKPLQSFWRRELGEKNWLFLQTLIPYSWVMTSDPLPPEAVYPRLEIQSWEELMNFSQKQRRLVIKVSGFSEQAWGSRGVWFGHDLSGEQWKNIVRESVASFHTSPRILQVFESGKVLPFDYLDETKNEMVSMQARIRLCPYYFVSESDEVKLGGILATICSADKKAVHGMKDAIMTTVASLTIH